MIQDAHPLRSGVPDGYEALYRIEVTAGSSSWLVNVDRLPSGFSGAGVAGNERQVRTGVGLGTITFPPGTKVRGAVGCYSCPNNTLANQRQVFVTDIDEAAGNAKLVLATPAGAAGDPADPTASANDSWIFVKLSLETV